MDETTPVTPTFFEKIKTHKKTIFTLAAIVGATALGFALGAATTTDDEDETDFDADLIILEPVADETAIAA